VTLAPHLQSTLAQDLLGKHSKGHPVVDVHGERHLWVLIFKNEEDSETWEMEQADQELYRNQRINIVSDIKKLGENSPLAHPNAATTYATTNTLTHLHLYKKEKFTLQHSNETNTETNTAGVRQA